MIIQDSIALGASLGLFYVAYVGHRSIRSTVRYTASGAFNCSSLKPSLRARRLNERLTALVLAVAIGLVQLARRQ